jgi:hypothetical protein
MSAQREDELAVVAGRIAHGEYYARELAESLRALLETPVGADTHLGAVTRAKALLKCYAEDCAAGRLET